MSSGPELGELQEVGWLESVDVHFAKAVASAEEPVLRLAAASASRFLREGHVCVPLAELSALTISGEAHTLSPFPTTEEFSAALARWSTDRLPAGGLPELDELEPADLPLELPPLVLDETGRLYLHRYYEHEIRLARALARLLAARRPRADISIETLFPSGECDPHQRAAALSVLDGGLTVISGGPGTGKTSTVVKLLSLLVQQSGKNGERPPRVLLLAPTGKAAARLSESIHGAKARLSLPQEVAAHIPEQAVTIHRALGVRPDSRTRFRRNESNPLDCDVVLVDEASMVDLSLMRHLIEATPPGAQLILLGDRDQLASVEAGSVLSELCHVLGENAPGRGGDAAGGAFVQLMTSYRFSSDSGIFRVSRAVREGDVAAVWEVLNERGQKSTAQERATAADDSSELDESKNGSTIAPGHLESSRGDVQLTASGSPADDPRFQRLVVDGFRPALERSEPEEVLCALDDFRVLCAHRTGLAGVRMLNERIRSWLTRAGLVSGSQEMYRGRLVMVTRNDVGTGLANGDVGLVWPDRAGKMSVHFSRVGGPARILSPAQLPNHETAFAMTVHKSQGSEYGHVCVVLPPATSQLLSRELLYTALTRARHRVTLWGPQESVDVSVTRSVMRFSGLGEALSRASENLEVKDTGEGQSQ